MAQDQPLGFQCASPSTKIQKHTAWGRYWGGEAIIFNFIRACSLVPRPSPIFNSRGWGLNDRKYSPFALLATEKSTLILRMFELLWFTCQGGLGQNLARSVLVKNRPLPFLGQQLTRGDLVFANDHYHYLDNSFYVETQWTINFGEFLTRVHVILFLVTFTNKFQLFSDS